MILEILTSSKTEEPNDSHQSIEAIAGKGLAGDRYATGKGFYSGVVEWDAHVTLIQREPFDALKADHGVSLEPSVLRRNLVTKGVELEFLIGKEFQIGDKAVFRGRKAWPPCAHIVKFSGRKEIFQYLARQSGIGVDVLIGGMIRVGDSIVVR
jgi:MOSC domain-containing protein YiiM